MKTIAAALEAHLASATQIFAVDLYTIILVDGTVIRWTGGQQPVPIQAGLITWGPSDDDAITWGGVPITWGDLSSVSGTWAVGPGIKRGKMSHKVGLSADTLTLTLYPRAADTVNGVPLVQSLMRGDFDGAAFRLDRAYSASPLSDVLGVVPRMVGGIANIDEATGAEIPVRVNSILRRLDAPYPRNVYSPGCKNVLFDYICGLDAALWRSTGSVLTVLSQSSFTTTLGQADEYFRAGRLRFLTGANAGRQMMVVKSELVGGRLTFARPWLATVAAGDTFEVWPGCDKTQATCSAKFSNAARFRGQPSIPIMETVT